MKNAAAPPYIDQNLNLLLGRGGMNPIEPAISAKLDLYLSLILRWNARMNLTAVRDPAGIVSRHFFESIACTQLLPTEISTLLDFGSGAGFPGIPIALCRPEIAVTLAESQAKKAAFLQETVRSLELNCQVWPKRAEQLGQQFDCVTLRAVDQMGRAVKTATKLIKLNGTLAVLTTQAAYPEMQMSAGEEFQWAKPFCIPGSEQRLIALGNKVAD